MIQNYRSYNIEVLGINTDEKNILLRVNNNNYTVQLRDQYDELLHRLGMDEMTSNKVNDLKAPMPDNLVAWERIAALDSTHKNGAVTLGQ